MTIVLNLGEHKVTAAMPADTLDGKTDILHLKLDESGREQLLWDMDWREEKFFPFLKKLLDDIVRCNPDVKMDFSVSLIIGCPPAEEWADAGKRALLEARIKTEIGAKEVRLVSERFPAALGALKCKSGEISVRKGMGLFHFGVPYLTFTYISPAGQIYSAAGQLYTRCWMPQNGILEKEELMRICMEAGGMLEDQGIVAGDLVLSGYWLDMGFVEPAVRKIFTEARIIRTNQEAFLMTEGLALSLLIDKKREEYIQRAVKKVDDESLGERGSYSALKQSIAKELNSKIQWLLEKKAKEKPQNERAAFSRKLFGKTRETAERLADVMKTYDDERFWELEILNEIGSWELSAYFDIPRRVNEGLDCFFSPEFRSACAAPPMLYWKFPYKAGDGMNQKRVARQIVTEVMRLPADCWQRELEEIVGQVIDREFGKKKYRENVERMAGYYYDSFWIWKEELGRSPKETEFARLAEQCRMGDREAMFEMAMWHRGNWNEEERRLMRDYEERPEDEETRESVRRATVRDGRSIKYYAVWLVRGALYGNWKAQKVLERYDVYKKISLIPEWMMAPPGSRGEEAAQTRHNALRVGGWELRRAGFTDVPNQEFECGLDPLEENGTYSFWYLSDYIPADESGFGREDEYETIYLDEFFNLVGLETENQKPEILKEKLRALEAKRDRYWESPLHDRRRRGIRKGSVRRNDEHGI